MLKPIKTLLGTRLITLIPLSIALIAIALTLRNGLPYGHDTEFHYYRQIAWDTLFKADVYYILNI